MSFLKLTRMPYAYLMIAVSIGTCFVLANGDAAIKTESKRERGTIFDPPDPPRPPSNADGGWSAWVTWTTCSRTCAGGVQFQRRRCNNPPRSGSGKRCKPPSYAVRRCSCDQVDGEWSAYGQWGACSATCGGGIKTRTRTCTNPSPSCCGEPCAGPSSYAASCNTQGCGARGAMANKFARGVMFNNYTRMGKSCRPRASICRPVVPFIPHSHGRRRRVASPCTLRPSVCKHTCDYTERDFLFILDASGSILSDNFETAKYDLMKLIQFLCGNLGTDLQVGAMVFSTSPQIVFPFDQHVLNEMDELSFDIMEIPYLNGLTHTWDAFDFARETMFTPANGNRYGVKKQALIITDGESFGPSNSRSLSITAAEALKRSGVELFALWIGDPGAADLEEIRQYVSNDSVDDHVFDVGGVASLTELAMDSVLLKQKTCCAP